jgi:hypothetical protein
MKGRKRQSYTILELKACVGTIVFAPPHHTFYLIKWWQHQLCIREYIQSVQYGTQARKLNGFPIIDNSIVPTLYIYFLASSFFMLSYTPLTGILLHSGLICHVMTTVLPASSFLPGKPSSVLQFYYSISAICTVYCTL